MAHIGERIREARPRWLGLVERKTEEGIVMRTQDKARIPFTR